MEPLLVSWPVVFVCTAAFTAGGLVKGLVSIGLPFAALPLLTLALDVPTSVTLLVIPILASNVIQACERTGAAALLWRFWPLIAGMVVGSLVGSALLVRIDAKTLSLALGGLIALAAIASLLNPTLVVPPRLESRLSAPVGLAAGLIGGMSTLYGPVLTLYLIGLKLPRDAFVQCMALLYLVGAGCLLIGGVAQRSATPFLLSVSALGCIPVYLGMLIGRRIRERTNPEMFRKLVLVFLALTGANLLRQGLGL